MLHGNERIVIHKIGLLNLAEELTSVSKACKIMGLTETHYTDKNHIPWRKAHHNVL